MFGEFICKIYLFLFFECLHFAIDSFYQEKTSASCCR